ncbi:MAG: InlB B-repeat-containing protein, partial [Spirochaetales bacterium]|nr:InlB B-repeat-containing protein [Spirochaetales bacterium]
AEAQVNLITYEANGATSGNAPAHQVKLPEQTLHIQTNSGNLAKTNYLFDGWNTKEDGTGIAYKEGDIYADSESLTLYAKWSEITYTITYDGNSSTSGSAPDKQTDKPGADITILDNSKELERTGYKFTGWNTKADGSGETYKPGVTYTNTKSFTLYAKWEAETYAVTLNYNGGWEGSSEETNTKQIYDSTIFIPTNLPTKFGYTLAGWNTNINGYGHHYNKGDTFKEAKNITLYAQWKLSTYTITYNGNCSTSGSVPEEQIKTHGTPIELNNNRGNLERTGYTFTGWNTRYNGSGSNFDVGSTYYTDQDLTLFAQWKVSTYTITYDGNSKTDGTVPAPQTKTHAIAIALAENSGNLSKIDYVFAGWNTKSDGSGTTYDEGTTFSVNKNITLYAKWLPKICTITYDSNFATDGTVPTAQQAERNTKVMIKGNTGVLIKEGYTFNGWNTATDGTGDTYNSNMYYKISTNLTLYAKWAENKYTITYDANSATEGNAPSPQIKSHGIDITLSLNTGALERAGYYLEGWNTKSDGSGITYAIGESYSENDDIILYAKWHSNTYTLTYDGNGNEKGTVPNPRKVTPSMLTTIDNNYGNLKKKGFIFCGWNTASDGSGTTYYPFEEFDPKQDLLLYANWQVEKAITSEIITAANFTPFGEFIWTDDSYNAIGVEAFKGDERLVSIKIPNFICHLGKSAFLDCKNLES